MYSQILGTSTLSERVARKPTILLSLYVGKGGNGEKHERRSGEENGLGTTRHAWIRRSFL